MSRPPPKGASGSGGNGSKARTKKSAEPKMLPVVSLAAVAPKQVDWLWFPYIPRAKITSVEGDPDVGKSWFTCAITAAVSRGADLPGYSLERPGRVLLLPAEDDIADTIRPRLDALNADPDQILIHDPDQEAGEPFVIGGAGVKVLERRIADFKPDLVILDPLMSFIGEKVNPNQGNQARAVMGRLKSIADRQGCAIVSVRHLTKGPKDKALYKGAGSIDITALCRSVMMLGLDPDDEEQRIVVHVKCNVAKKGPALGFTIGEGGFKWTGEVDVTADQLWPGEEDADRKSAKDKAVRFLKDELKDGPVAQNEVESHAKEAGISVATLRRAKKAAGVKSEKEGGVQNSPWFWYIPKDRS